jgi:hypothetical protein
MVLRLLASLSDCGLPASSASAFSEFYFALAFSDFCVNSIDSSPFITISMISVSQDEMGFRLRECFLEDFDGSTIYRSLGF